MTAKDSQFCNGKEVIYIRHVAWAIECLKNVDEHCGDCTCIPQSCTKCLFEDEYCDALRDLSYFENVKKDKLEQYNGTIL